MRPVRAYHRCSGGIRSSLVHVNTTSGPNPSHWYICDGVVDWDLPVKVSRARGILTRLLGIVDHLRRRLARIKSATGRTRCGELCADFLQSRSHRFNLLLLVRGSRLEILLLLGHCRFEFSDCRFLLLNLAGKEKKGSVLTIDTLEKVRLNAAMARQLRIQYDGAIYHLLSRGDRREEIFRDDVDRKSFVETLGVACEKTDWHVHAYCLMGNHFHLVVETPRANLVEGMKWLLGTYTMRFN